MKLELPARKLSQLTALLEHVASWPHISERQLLSLIDKLSWAAQVVRGGRTFVRRLINTSLRLREPSHRIRTCGSFMQDINFWRAFLAHFNGKAPLIQGHITSLSTDACPVAWVQFTMGTGLMGPGQPIWLLLLICRSIIRNC